MKICFLTRVDAFDKNGGDTYQLQMYQKHLQENHHEVLIVTSLNIPQGFDKYVLVNIDRPIELLWYYSLLQVRKLESKTFLLSIHHSYKAIDFFEEHIRGGKIKLINKFAKSFFQREKVKNFIRLLKYRVLLKPALTHIFKDYKKSINDMIEHLPAVIIIAEDECKDIENDFNVKINNAILVKNGVELQVDDFIQNEIVQDIDVLICGRIESRKNSLAIAKFFSDKAYKVAFVGALNQNDPDYAKSFLNVIELSEYVDYLGRVNSQDMPAIYRRSKLHLSASWFEVASLVDLEAYAYGCRVISSVNGHTKSYLGGRAVYYDPCNLDNIEKTLKELLLTPVDKNEQYNFIAQNYTWERSHLHLVEGLERFNPK